MPTGKGKSVIALEVAHDFSLVNDKAKVAVVCSTEQYRGKYKEAFARKMKPLKPNPIDYLSFEEVENENFNVAEYKLLVIDEGDLALNYEFLEKFLDNETFRCKIVFMSATPYKLLEAEQKYFTLDVLDTQSLYPDPNIKVERYKDDSSPEMIIFELKELAKSMTVLAYAPSLSYIDLLKDENTVMVDDAIRQDMKAFDKDLMESKKGLYLITSEKLMRAHDFRTSDPYNGLTLGLMESFPNETTYF